MSYYSAVQAKEDSLKLSPAHDIVLCRILDEVKKISTGKDRFNFEVEINLEAISLPYDFSDEDFKKIYSTLINLGYHLMLRDLAKMLTISWNHPRNV